MVSAPSVPPMATPAGRPSALPIEGVRMLNRTGTGSVALPETPVESLASAVMV